MTNVAFATSRTTEALKCQLKVQTPETHFFLIPMGVFLCMKRKEKRCALKKGLQNEQTNQPTHTRARTHVLKPHE